MAKNDIKKLDINQLRSKLKDNEEALLNYRFQKVLQQLEDPFKIRQTKREIARIKTILREYKLDIRKVAK